MRVPHLQLVQMMRTSYLFFLSLIPAIALGEGVQRAVVIIPGDYQELVAAPYLNNGLLEFTEQLRLAGITNENIVVLNGSQQAPLTNEMIYSTLEEFVDISEPQDLLLVAIAGHGMQLNSEDYICLGATKKKEVVDQLESDSTTVADTTHMVKIQEIVSAMSASAAGQKLLIIDSAGSRSPLKDGGSFPQGTDANLKFGTQVLSISDGTWTICNRSGRITEANKGDKSKTRFMRSVLEGLALHADANNNKSVSLLEISDYIQQFAEAENSVPPVFQGKLNVDFELVQTTRESTADALPESIRDMLYAQMRDLAIKSLVIERDAEIALNAIERATLYARAPQLKSELEGLQLTALAASGKIQEAWELANRLERSLLLVVAHESNVFQEKAGKMQTQLVQRGRRYYYQQVNKDPISGKLAAGAMVRVVELDSKRAQFDMAFQQIESDTKLEFEKVDQPGGWLELNSISATRTQQSNAVTVVN